MNKQYRAPQKDNGPRINEDIRVDKVRLIDEEGNQIGIVATNEAIEKAYNVGLDLVEVSPNADPPVCKILDYGKYKYEQQKKAAEARKKQKTIEVKEIKLRPNTDDHDYDVKKRHAIRFLEDHNKVKVTLRFRGREMAHQDIGRAMLERLRDDLKDLSKTELSPMMEGRRMIMILAPESSAD